MKFSTILILALAYWTVLKADDGQLPIGTVFRKPFTLVLGIDKEHYYEEKFEKAPYVYSNGVYLFKGDHFGVKFVINKDEIAAVRYESDISKADAILTFSQEKVKDDLLMILKIENRTKFRLNLDALMTVPGQKGVYKTSIVPVEAGLTDYESWHHPIVQLVLREFHVSETGEHAGQVK